MCIVLKISRSVYYYKAKQKQDQSVLVSAVTDIFRSSRNNYGTRKIKAQLRARDIIISRRRIAQIMRQAGLVSNYTSCKYRPHKTACNESKAGNVINRQFAGQPYRNAVVSDLTYVKVGTSWNYICILLDLFNREIIGYSAGKNKDSRLVKTAFYRIRGNLADIAIFHTDRGSEFKNELIDEVLDSFEIRRSLSSKGCPYDNAVAEATFKIIKTEFVNAQRFNDLEELSYRLSDYVNCFNNHRLHSSLDYLSPAEFRKKSLINSV